MTDLFLRDVSLQRGAAADKAAYPFSIPAIGTLGTLPFGRVTFFVGENGTGKSTLLEGIAILAGFNAEGGSRNFNFSTCETHSALAGSLMFTRGMRRARDGYFLRAESFYNAVSYMDALDKLPAAAPRIKDSYGGKSLHECSHGESFFALLQNRLGGDGLYLFDEPEAALSPQRQLAMLCRMKQLADDGAQLIIATHSPILLAYPDAVIYSFDDVPVHTVAYEDTAPYQITKAFVNNPQGMLRTLFEPETGEAT